MNQQVQNPEATKSDPGAKSSAGEKLCAYWKDKITEYEQEFSDFEKTGDEVYKRYRAKKKTGSSKRQYNILYSNVSTLLPALYFAAPKPNIERRFKDQSPVSLKAAEILERTTAYFVNESSFHDNAKNVVKDRLLPGRGVMWVRYVPHFNDVAQTDAPNSGVQITDDAEAGEQTPEQANNPKTQEAPQEQKTEIEEELEYEEIVFDYVYWKDFGHVLARTWDEVPAVWRRVYLSRAECVRRWGKEKGDKIPLDYSPDDKNEQVHSGKKACIFEIWDKEKGQVVWISKSMGEAIDATDDPLKIKGFFPCPKPLYASTMTTENLIPTPDYIQYQDQARELDELTARIASITKSLKVAGVYDTTAEGIQQLLSEGLENKLIPIKSWALHAEKGGIGKAIEFLPLEMIAKVLEALHNMRDKVKKDLDEITGMADIIRGNSDPDETAEAQYLKGQFATLRLSDGQNEVKQFMKQVVQIGAEIVAKHFNQETLAEISGVKLMTQEEKKQYKMMQMAKAQMAAQRQAPQGMGAMQPPGGAPAAPGQPPQPQQAAPAPQQPEEQEPEGLNDPTWEEVMALLKDNAALCFKIDIETDSTIKQDQEAEKKSATEFIKVAAEAIAQIAQAQNPIVAKLGAKLLMFGVRRFKAARELEGVFEDVIKEIEENPPQQQQPPDPAIIKAQSAEKIAAQNNQVKLQTTQMQLAAEAQNTNTTAEATKHVEAQENQAWAQNEAAKLSVQQQLERFKQDNENHRLQMQQMFEAMMAKMGHVHTMQQQAAAPKPKAEINGGSHV